MTDRKGEPGSRTDFAVLDFHVDGDTELIAFVVVFDETARSSDVQADLVDFTRGRMGYKRRGKLEAAIDETLGVGKPIVDGRGDIARVDARLHIGKVRNWLTVYFEVSQRVDLAIIDDRPEIQILNIAKVDRRDIDQVTGDAVFTITNRDRKSFTCCILGTVDAVGG